jgi:glycosyltransferase involved in cell wall biosynthesis
MRDMIVFGEDWGRHPSSTQHLVRLLAEESQIIWVNSLGLRRPRFNRADFKRLAEKAKSAFRGSRVIETGTDASHPFAALVNPKAISWPGSRVAAAINRMSLQRQLKPLMKQKRIGHPILWTSLPTVQPLAGALLEHALVYYAGDDFGALAGVDHKQILVMERELAQKADLIIAASPLIAERFPSHKTKVLAHGVDYQLFAETARRADDLPQGRPIAGFYGSINEWLDISLIAKAAAALPDWDIVLIGKIETDVTTLRACGNVHFLGPRPHHELPRYSQHWDVSLLPFKHNRQIDASNPLKMREYLAAGQPILASYRFPAAQTFGEAILVPEENEAFADAIQRAKTDPRSKAWRQSLVRHHSWKARAATLRSWLEAL